MREDHDMTTVEWGVMEAAPKKPHGNTLPENRKKRGDVTPCASREEAVSRAELRARVLPQHPLVVVSRTVTVSAWVEAE